MNKELIILGNGPSLLNVDFNLLKNKDTFGLNGAYKLFQKNNWYPKYYGLLDDYKKRKQPLEEINVFINSKPPIDSFFFYGCEKDTIKAPSNSIFLNLTQPTRNEVEYDQSIFSTPWQYFIQDVITELELTKQQDLIIPCCNLISSSIEARYKLTVKGLIKTVKKEPLCEDDYLKIQRYSLMHVLPYSFDNFFYFGGHAGVIACHIGMCFAYKKIILLGTDCNWKKTDGVYNCKDNHCISDYFPNDVYKSDDFNSREFDPIKMQLDNWNNLSDAIKANDIDIDIVNCSPGSRVECFRVSTLEKELCI